MPSFCAVVGCGSRGQRDDVKFFRIPAVVQYKHKLYLVELSKLRRELWLDALRRADLTENKLKYLRICSKHFIGGKYMLFYSSMQFESSFIG